MVDFSAVSGAEDEGGGGGCALEAGARDITPVPRR